MRELEEAQAELSRQRDVPHGRLRISLPALGYRMLLPILPEFTRRYPQIELDLDFSDRMVDVIAEGMDAVVRSGEVLEDRLVAGGRFSLLWPGSRQPLPKLRVFIDFLAERLVLGPQLA